MIAVLLALVFSVGLVRASDEIVSMQDVPLQTTWYRLRPNKAPSVKSHEGLLHADTYSWKCAPVLAQSFKHDSKRLLLGVHIDGPEVFTFASIVFSVDGDVITIPPVEWKSATYLGGLPVQETLLTGQETLIRKIATAHEVWITILAQNRHSVRLSDRQIQTFGPMLSLYDSLEPNDRH